MMDARTKGWVKAANLFADDLQAKVVCPDCQNGLLRAENIALPNGDVVERMIYCAACGAKSYVRVKGS